MLSKPSLFVPQQNLNKAKQRREGLILGKIVHYLSVLYNERICVIFLFGERHPICNPTASEEL